MSSEAAIEAEFTSLDQGMNREMTVYLMGGGAMTFRGLKNATRDLDLLVTARDDFDILRDLLRDRGYETVENPVDEYESLGAALMLDKDEECRFDIFDREVIRKLRLSDGMEDRADVVFDGSNLRVRGLSNEDIFLFKGVAGRPRDTDDMAQLVEAGRGLDLDVIDEEFHDQLPMNTGRIEWELLTGAPENHPVIAFERAVLSLPMTLPETFTNRIEQEADRVYAEFEIVNEIGHGTTMSELTRVLTSRNTIEANSQSDVEAVVRGLVAKDLVHPDGDTLHLNEFDTES